jgi:multiple sugar transport system substrate-binding protein
MSEPKELVIRGRAFDGFERSFATQLAANSDIAARFELIEIGDLERSVLHGDAATSGATDILLLITDWLPALIHDERLIALDDYFAVEAPEGWPDSWAPAMRQLQQGPDGRTYGVAYHDGPMLVLYRTDLYQDDAERSGFSSRYGYPLAPPTDWKEFRDQAEWFNRPEIGLYGTVQAGFPDEHNNVYDFLTHLWSRGGELINDDGTSGLNSPAAQSAIDFIHDLWHVSKVVNPDAANWDSVASGIHFAAGEAAMMLNWCGFAAISADPDSPTHGLVGCAPSPSGEGPNGQAVTMNAYWVLTVAAGTTQPERAVDLIRRLVTHDMDVVTALSGGSATRIDSWNDQTLRASAPYYEVLEDAHAHSRSVPVDPRWPEMARILNTMMRDVVQNAAEEGALAEAHRQLSALLAR